MTVNFPQLSAKAVASLRETVEAEYAVGSRKNASALELLLEWHEKYAVEIERLTRERHAFAIELRHTTDAFIKADDAKRASKARNAALLKALERYGRHDSKCAAQKQPYHIACTCGLAAAKG